MLYCRRDIDELVYDRIKMKSEEVKQCFDEQDNHKYRGDLYVSKYRKPMKWVPKVQE
jgi:hypothetical protein